MVAYPSLTTNVVNKRLSNPQNSQHNIPFTKYIIPFYPKTLVIKKMQTNKNFIVYSPFFYYIEAVTKVFTDSHLTISASSYKFENFNQIIRCHQSWDILFTRLGTQAMEV